MNVTPDLKVSVEPTITPEKKDESGLETTIIALGISNAAIIVILVLTFMVLVSVCLILCSCYYWYYRKRRDQEEEEAELRTKVIHITNQGCGNDPPSEQLDIEELN